jgi:PAS domain S-box-containing protein
MNRISKLIEVVRKAVEGDFSLRVEASDTNDETDRLADAINQLIEKMGAQVAGQKQTEAALRESEEKYRRLQANIPGMVYLFARHADGSFSFPYVNGESKKLFDIAPEDLMADASLIISLMHPDDRARFDMSVRQSVETLRPWREVLRHIVNGEVRWYDCMSRPELQANGDIVWDGIMLEITDRMQAVESLRESEQKLSGIIAASPVGIAIYDASGQCLAVNDSLTQIIGASKQQVLGQNYHEIASWQSSGLLNTARMAVGTQSAKRLEVTTISSFGKRVFLDCHLVPFGPKGLLFMGQDISERKQAEAELSKSERLLNNIFEQNPHPIWISDDKGNLIRINKACCDLLDIMEEDVLGRYNVLQDNIVIEQGYLPLVQSVYNEGKTANFTIEYDSAQLKHIQPARGVYVILDVTISPVKDESGNLINAVIIHRDITEARKAVAALQRSKAYAEKLIESANAMIVVLNAQGQIRVVNKAAEEITGYSRHELLGSNWFELLAPRDKYPKVWEVFQKAAQEGLAQSFENPILTKAGEERFISFRNAELCEDGAFAGCISYGIDITERKQLEDQLLQSQKMEAVGQLAGGVAHDFNNMLSVILGHAELVKDSLPAEHPLLMNVMEIEKAGLHSRDITRQLLAFSRKQIIAPKTTNLNQLIVHIKKTLAQLIGENIELRFSPGKDLWKIRIDPTQIDQILINLAVNARDALPDGGVLTIETANVHLDELYCSLNVECRPGHYVLLAVSDNGVGMGDEILAHVFEPFFTTKEVGKGTGLGLATVYGIVKQNGGFISVYSEPGKGSSFKIYIPRIMDEDAVEKATGETSLPFRNGTVLLVEDDDMVRRMTVSVLKKIGYAVVTAATPLEALAFFDKDDTPIDLLITDVVMPQMSGAELYDKIKMIKPELNVLFMSGYTENVIVRHGVLKEGIHFVQKPFTMHNFARKVRDAMEDSKA